MAKLTKDEFSKIAEILSPLDKDPIRNETLNPMSRVLRKIKGLPELIPDKDEALNEVKEEPDTIEGGIELADDAILESTTPPQMKYFDENDVDIDELLNDAPDLIAGQSVTPKKEIIQDTPPITQVDDDVNMFGADDPFAMPSETQEEPADDLLAADDSLTESDPFGGFDDKLDDSNADSIEEDPFAMDDSGLVQKDESTDDPFGNMEAVSEEDPFGDVGTAFNKSSVPNAMDTDPFADVVPGGMDSEDDPFADLSDTSSSTEEDPFGAIGQSTEATVDDPFSGFNEDIGNANEDSDPFADIGKESLSVEDSFAGLDDNDASSNEDSFGDLGTISDGFGDSNDLAGFDDSTSSDMFGDLDSSQPASDDSYDSSSSFDSSGVDDDPFADIQQSTGIGHDFETENTVDDFASSFDDLGSGIGDSNGDTSSSLDVIDDAGPATESSYDSLDEDLDSLAQEEEAEEDLSDEELAVILKYPPKLKRTVIDVITNDKLPKSEQRELVELIKSSQKPEDIAAYLTEKLGYPVDLYDKSGAYSERGIPVISTKPIYTKEGELRRRELIKRTALMAAAGILLVVGLISSYKYVLRPFQAARRN